MGFSNVFFIFYNFLLLLYRNPHRRIWNQIKVLILICMNLFLKNWIDLFVSCNDTLTTVLLDPIWNKPNTAIRRSLQRNFWGVVFKYVCEICSWSNENTWSMLLENVGIYRLYIIHKLQNSDPIQEFTDNLFSQVLEHFFECFLSQSPKNISFWNLQPSVLTA